MEIEERRALELDQPGVWTGRASATVSINGRNTVSSSFGGSFGFTVYLVESPESTLPGSQIPHDSALGHMGGSFNAEISTDTEEVSGSGTLSYFIGGVYDPASEIVRVTIRKSGVEATGKHTLLGDPASGVPAAVVPVALNWNTGRRSPMDDAYEDIPKERVILKPPEPPIFRPDRTGDSYLFESLPQTGLSEEEMIVLDLKDPSPQTFTRVDEGGSPFGTRITTWTFTLVPLFSIERDDRRGEGANSFISTDSISFHIAIPGVTVPESRWASLVSWQVTGQGHYAGNGVPSQASQSAAFTFKPNPSNRPRNGSYARNRPISYDVAATIEGTTQHHLLVQDEIDTLRQEYIDHNEARVPSRGEFVPYPVDGGLNMGNYNLIIDDGMRLTLERIARRFRQFPGRMVTVSGGYSSPQRNRMVGGRTGDQRVFGRSLELVPQPSDAQGWSILKEACTDAGCGCLFEVEPGEVMSSGSPRIKHLRVTWKAQQDGAGDGTPAPVREGR